MQHLGKNKIFESLDSVDWISKIELSENRETQIRESFCYASVEFHYPIDVGEFETILESLKDNKADLNIDHEDLCIREKDVFDRIIVMDDVSGLSRKCRYTCVYIFHIMSAV